MGCGKFAIAHSNIKRLKVVFYTLYRTPKLEGNSTITIISHLIPFRKWPKTGIRKILKGWIAKWKCCLRNLLFLFWYSKFKPDLVDALKCVSPWYQDLGVCFGYFFVAFLIYSPRLLLGLQSTETFTRACGKGSSWLGMEVSTYI